MRHFLSNYFDLLLIVFETVGFCSLPLLLAVNDVQVCICDDGDDVFRSSIVRMSSDRKQDMVTKTVEDERIKVGVLRAVVDEAEERDVSLVNDENEEEGVDEESEKSDDTNKSGSAFSSLNLTVKKVI